MKTVPMSVVKARYNPGHWFDRSSMRFFRTILPRNAYEGPGGTFFVTSEQVIGSNGNVHPRRYTVRQFKYKTFVTDDEYKQNSSTATIQTVGEFNVAGRDEAIRAAKLYAEYGVKQ